MFWSGDYRDCWGFIGDLMFNIIFIVLGFVLLSFFDDFGFVLGCCWLVISVDLLFYSKVLFLEIVGYCGDNYVKVMKYV